jgi:hypothetical protein
MDPKTLLPIMLALGGAGLEPQRPGLLSIEGGGEPGGGGGDPPKLTQAEVDKIVGERLAREKQASTKATADAVAAAVAKANEEHTAKMAELEARIADAGKSEAEKTKAAADREAKAQATRYAKIEADLAAANKAKADADAALVAATQARHTDALKTRLISELVAAKTPASVVADAVDLMLLRSKVAFDETGKPSIEGFGGTYADEKSAVAAFLKQTPAFAHHPGGGGGTKSGSGGLPAGMKSGELVGGNAARLLQSGLGELSMPSVPDFAESGQH